MKLRPIFLALWMIMLLSMGNVFLTVSLSAQDACLSAAEDSRFGVMSHLSWGFLYDSEKIVQTLTMMNATGIRWVRVKQNSVVL